MAVFPFDMVLQKNEDEFYVGPQGPSDEEKRRLELAHAQLAEALKADERYSIVDLSGVAADISAAAPLYLCNGCELDIAGKAKAELAMTSVIDKISETHLSLTVSIVDVAKSALVKNASVLIQGNTDEAWLHGVRWLVKNRLLVKESAQ